MTAARNMGCSLIAEGPRRLRHCDLAGGHTGPHHLVDTFPKRFGDADHFLTNVLVLALSLGFPVLLWAVAR